MNPKHPSAEYTAYCEAMRAAAPFAPCERYQPIPAGCAVCVHSLDEPPCPELCEVFRIDDPAEVVLSMVPVLDFECGGI